MAVRVNSAAFEFVATLGIKATYLVFSTLAAVVAVLLDRKRYTWFTAILAIIAGALVAILATDPIVSVLGLPEGAAHGIAGVLGITGRNIIVWLNKASENPLKAWNEWRKK
jgi:membrane associated rhomboid family serine protease